MDFKLKPADGASDNTVKNGSMVKTEEDKAWWKED